MLESGARAVFFSGHPDAGAVALWQQLHAADPHLRLLGPSSARRTLVRRADRLRRGAHLPRPPRCCRSRSTRRPRSGCSPNTAVASTATAGPYALYGYEAMSVVLLAIHRAGRHGDDREAVIHQFFAIHDRDSVLGRYSMLPDGDTHPLPLRGRPRARGAAGVLPGVREAEPGRSRGLGLRASSERCPQRLVEVGVAELVAEHQRLRRQHARAGR